jgi:hypothetical protein
MKNAITIKKTLITFAVFASFATAPLVQAMERQLLVPVLFLPRTAEHSRFNITITPSMTVGELKQKIKQEQNIPIEQYAIIAAGKFLNDNDEAILQNIEGSRRLEELNLSFGLVPKPSLATTLQLANGSSRTLNLDATTSVIHLEKK